MSPDLQQLTEFQNLAALRSALRSDGPEKDTAYESVYDAGLRPDDVLGSDPPEEQLAEQGVIPAPEQQGPPAVEQRAQIIDLLKEIRDNTGGSA